jgi:hypothetical protein
MPQQDRPRARTEQQDDVDTGFDVWIPMIVAIVAAIYLVVAANAQSTDAPRAIFDANRFEESAVALETAEARAGRAMSGAEAAEAASRADRLKIGPVIIAALPELEPALVEADPEAATVGWTGVRSVDVQTDAPQPGVFRIVTPIGIALLLIAVLFGLDRTWQRTRGQVTV